MGSEAAAVVENHARRCLACGRLWTKARSVRELLSKVGEETAWPMLDEGFFARLRGEVLAEIQDRRRRNEEQRRLAALGSGVRRRRAARVLAGIASLAAALLLGFVLGNRFGPRPLGPQAPLAARLPGAAAVALEPGADELISSRAFREMVSDPEFAERLRVLWRSYLEQLPAAGAGAAPAFPAAEGAATPARPAVLANLPGRADF